MRRDDGPKKVGTPQITSAMNIPKNVWRFEVLLYASLVLDALSVAFQDRTPTPRMTEQMINVSTWLALGLLLLLFYFVWLAARRKKSWPRWALAAALALSLISLAQVIGERGIQFDVLVDTVSCALTALGLYLSFTGDAKDWFDA
jgi:drug/metabolite transporter (DMT)-like permease